MAQSAVNWHNTHTHMECTHLLAHLNQHSYKLQPRCAKCQLSYYFSVHAASFHVSVIHQTLTWNTGSLLCICDHSCACIYTHRGWAHQQRVSRTFLTQKNSQKIYCAPDGIQTSALWITSPTLYQLSHPITKLGGEGYMHCLSVVDLQHYWLAWFQEWRQAQTEQKNIYSQLLSAYIELLWSFRNQIPLLAPCIIIEHSYSSDLKRECDLNGNGLIWQILFPLFKPGVGNIIYIALQRMLCLLPGPLVY